MIWHASIACQVYHTLFATKGSQYYKLKIVLLPPTNEVWGKVIFSEACVKNSVHRGGVWSGGVPDPKGDALSGWGGLVLGGVCVATVAGGMHPTGMYSCFL